MNCYQLHKNFGRVNLQSDMNFLNLFIGIVVLFVVVANALKILRNKASPSVDFLHVQEVKENVSRVIGEQNRLYDR